MTTEDDPVRGANQNEIVQLLTAHKRLTRDELLDKAENIVDAKALSNALYLLKGKKIIRQAGDGSYELTDQSSAPERGKHSPKGEGATALASGTDHGRPPSTKATDPNATAKGRRGNGAAPSQPRRGDLTAWLTSPLVPPPPHPHNPRLVEILQRALDEAQASLDEYIASVCDSSILGPLKAMRDHARQALENFRKATAPSD